MAEVTDDLKSILSIEKMSKTELIRAIRVSIKAEIDAVHLYTMIAEATDDERIREIMLHTAEEEKKHIGEFLKALQIIEPEEFGYYNDGAAEIENLLGANTETSSNPNPGLADTSPFEDKLSGIGTKLDEALKDK